MITPTQIRVPQRRVEPCMGTVFSIDVRRPGVDGSALDAAISWLHWVDNTFSTYRPSSEVSRLARGELSRVDCSPEVRNVLDRCQEMTEETSGYFSVHATGSFDPSGYVKGWAVETVSEMLRAAGSANHCVNGGGDIQCAGEARPGQPWRIGIADPHDRQNLVGAAVGTDLAVATSGTAERGDHISNPFARGRRTGLASVTLVGRRLARIDAYATAAFAMGEAAPDWIASRPDVSGLVVFADGRTWVTPARACRCRPSCRAPCLGAEPA